MIISSFWSAAIYRRFPETALAVAKPAVGACILTLAFFCVLTLDFFHADACIFFILMLAFLRRAAGS